MLIITYPGFGMAGLIATDYLRTEKNLPRIARVTTGRSEHAYLIIHQGEEYYPISMYKDDDMLILTSLSSLHGLEESFLQLITRLHEAYAFERILILDAFSRQSGEARLYHHPDVKEGLESKPLREGVIIGIYPLLRLHQLPVRAYFAEASPNSIDIPAARKLLTAYLHETGHELDLTQFGRMEEAYKQRVHGMIQRQKHAERDRQHQHQFYIG